MDRHDAIRTAAHDATFLARALLKAEPRDRYDLAWSYLEKSDIAHECRIRTDRNDPDYGDGSLQAAILTTHRDDKLPAEPLLNHEFIDCLITALKAIDDHIALHARRSAA